MPHQDRFFTPNQMNRFRDVALLGMTTTVLVERRATEAPPPDDDYGDDNLSFTVTNPSRRLEVKGWLFSTPTPTQQIDTGAVITVNTYRLIVPVGTDVLPGDHVRVGTDEYTVSDTDAESTWLPYLTCSLRKSE